MENPDWDFHVEKVLMKPQVTECVLEERNKHLHKQMVDDHS